MIHCSVFYIKPDIVNIIISGPWLNPFTLNYLSYHVIGY